MNRIHRLPIYTRPSAEAAARMVVAMDALTPPNLTERTAS